jgi:hypothetical protein
MVKVVKHIIKDKVRQMGQWGGAVPLIGAVDQNMTPWKITIFNGKTHYFCGHFQ